MVPISYFFLFFGYFFHIFQGRASGGLNLYFSYFFPISGRRPETYSVAGQRDCKCRAGFDLFFFFVAFPCCFGRLLCPVIGPLTRRVWGLTVRCTPLGVSQRALTLILPQKYRDTNGRRIVIQIGGVYTTFCHREGIHLQKYVIEMGGVSRYFFTCIGVRGRFDSPDTK